ncbi:MAG: hypothetical protein IJU03_08095 [Thermoguttaceae bacterium]|nr:hypothetical protein [Thermoguttaceae bacterium]
MFDFTKHAYYTVFSQHETTCAFYVPGLDVIGSADNINDARIMAAGAIASRILDCIEDNKSIPAPLTLEEATNVVEQDEQAIGLDNLTIESIQACPDW